MRLENSVLMLKKGDFMRCYMLFEICTLAFTFTALAQDSLEDTTARKLISLDSESNRIVWLHEAAYWPTDDIFEKNKVNKTQADVSETVCCLRTMIRKENMPEKPDSCIRFLNGWRSNTEDCLFLIHENAKMFIHIRDMVVSVQVTPERKDKSFWFAIVCQAKGKDSLVDKTNKEAIFAFVDSIICDNLGSTAQDYSNVTNIREPVFQAVGQGSLLMYPVKHKLVSAVCIWTNGNSVVIALRKAV